MAPRTPFLLKTTHSLPAPTAPFNAKRDASADSGGGGSLLDSLVGEIILSGVSLVLIVWLICGVLLLLRARHRRHVDATPTAAATAGPATAQTQTSIESTTTASAGATLSSSPIPSASREVGRGGRSEATARSPSLLFPAPLPYSISVIDGLTTRLGAPCSGTLVDAIRPPAYEEIYKEAPRNT